MRGFTDRAVSREVLEKVLSAAARAPSGSNLQPWRTFVVTGAPLAQLKKLAVERVAAGDPWDERALGFPQWADVGMYLQTVMLLLRAGGLHSCPQMAWSQVRKTVAEVVSPSDDLILFCGMSIGFEDIDVRHTRTGRAPLEDTVTFIEDPREPGSPAPEQRV